MQNPGQTFSEFRQLMKIASFYTASGLVIIVCLCDSLTVNCVCWNSCLFIIIII